MIPGILTASQVAAAYAEMDRLNSLSRNDRKDYVQGRTSLQVGHRVSELRQQIERSSVLVAHVAHDRLSALEDCLAKLEASAQVAPP